MRPHPMPHPDETQTQQDIDAQTCAQDDLVEQALFILTPFFLDGTGGDPARARRVAVEMLKAYPINTMLELQLATEFIAFSYAAMDDLRLAKADPEMAEPQRRKLRAGAVALNRAGHRTLRILENVFQSRSRDAAGRDAPSQDTAGRDAAGQMGPAPNPPLNLSPGQLAMLQAMRERVAQAREQMAAGPGALPAAMNREQRRAAELAAQREARRAAG
jgi:hypothetical protein